MLATLESIEPHSARIDAPAGLPRSGRAAVIVACMALFKLLLAHLRAAPLVDSFLFSMNYSIGYMLIHVTHVGRRFLCAPIAIFTGPNDVPADAPSTRRIP